MASSLLPRFRFCPSAIVVRRLIQVPARSFSLSSATMAKAKVQLPAPTFSAKAVVSGNFKDVKLEDYRGKYVVLFFYPLDFTFVCPTEVVAFSDRIQEFADLNCQVLGVSVDSHFCHKVFIETPRKDQGLGGLNFPLVSDINKSISRDYGVLLEDAGISLRGLFIIDEKGTLRQSTINDLPVGRSVDETLRLVKAFQFTDKYGEVCPADWQPNKPTINPAKASEYFGKVK